MRQADILDAIRDIVLGASIDASPENYDICHRFVTRSDQNVCAGFEAELAHSTPITADQFGKIQSCAGPARGHVDTARFMSRMDEQLGTIADATSDALGQARDYGRSLQAGEDDIKALRSGADASALIAKLAAQTNLATTRAVALETKLARASADLAGLRQELEKAKVESGNDALTSLPNRRSFDSRLVDAIGAAGASGQPLSLAFCDIDNFKKFNDNWGHALGDQVLRFVGAQLAKQFEGVGSPARFGGEEFVLLLPAFGSAQAFDAISHFCELIRSRILRTRSDGREIGNVTLSVGIATLRKREDAGSFLERADAAMYAAKKAGRNRVVFAN